LILAACWGVLGLGLWIVPWITGSPTPDVRLGTFHFHPSWIALCLTIYNLVRWYSRRSLQAQGQAMNELRRRRQRLHAEEEKPAEEPNPDFDFGEERRP
jgi:hypothetical protein